eukprot:gene9998-7882_t
MISLLLTDNAPWVPKPPAPANVAASRTLYDKYGAQGFNLIAFPCNQAPGSSEEERQWAFRKFGFEFDVFDKIEVNGKGAHPLYKYMESLPETQGKIEWNYTKFIVRLLLAGKPPLPQECILHPGRIVCNVDRALGLKA